MREGNVCTFTIWPFDGELRSVFLVMEIQIQHRTLQAHSRRASQLSKLIGTKIFKPDVDRRGFRLCYSMKHF